MRAVFRAVEPEKMEFSLTVTMPLKEWRELRTSLSVEGGYTSSRLCSAITDMTMHAEKHFRPEEAE